MKTRGLTEVLLRFLEHPRNRKILLWPDTHITPTHRIYSVVQNNVSIFDEVEFSVERNT